MTTTISRIIKAGFESPVEPVTVEIIRSIRLPSDRFKMWSLEHEANFELALIEENLTTGQVRFYGFKLSRQNIRIGKKLTEILYSSESAIKDIKDYF